MADTRITLTDHTPAMDRNRRERLGISADDLAARAGISPQELTSYEQAKSEADGNPTTAMKIADALDAIEAEMPGEDEEPEAHPT